MADYSRQKISNFSAGILFLSMVAMIIISGCGDQNFSISGTVTKGGTAIPDVIVTLSSESGDVLMTATTDADGNYVFSAVKEDTYVVSPDPTVCNFVPGSRKVYLFGIDATEFNFSCSGQGRVAAGGTHTVAETDGTVRAWGNNSNGQLGDGTTTQSVTPVQVSGLGDVTAIAGGNLHTVAVKKSDGTIWAWGSNSSGQLGNDNTTDSKVPVQVSSVSGLTDAIAVAAGNAHTVALKSDKTVWTWGDNAKGQLGNGNAGGNSNVPVPVSGLTDVIAIAAGNLHTVAVKSDGTVWAWGSNSTGQLGNGTTTDSNVPVQVSGLAHVIAVAAGSSHTVALDSDGTVRAWGDNTYGQLGDGTNTQETTPVKVNDLSDAIAVAAGSIHTAAVKTDGTVWAWGRNSNGQLGNGTTTDSNVPVQVSGLAHVIAVAAGSSHTVALKTDDTIWAWGNNSNGQLGDGTTNQATIPVQVQLLLPVGFF